MKQIKLYELYEIEEFKKDYIIIDNDIYNIRIRKDKNKYFLYAYELMSETNKVYITWLSEIKTYEDIANELTYFDIDIINIDKEIDKITNENVKKFLTKKNKK